MTTETTLLSGTTYNGLSTTTASAVSSLSENYDMFVSLLTAQLENQNPLDPTDTDEITQQLVSFSQVEQAILTNQYLENLVLSTGNEASQVALSFLGKEVTYDAAEQTYSDEDLSWSMDVPDDTETLSIEVQNEDGLTVYQAEIEPDGDSYTFTWDGTTTTGTATTGDSYSLVVTATHADGTTEEIDLQATSVATQVDWSTGSPQLILANGSTAELSAIISARSIDADA